MIGETNAKVSNKGLEQYDVWTKLVNGFLKGVGGYLSSTFKITKLETIEESYNMFYTHFISQSANYSNDNQWIGYCIFSEGNQTAITPVYKDNTGVTHLGEKAVTVQDGERFYLFTGGSSGNLRVQNSRGESASIKLENISFDIQKELVYDPSISVMGGDTVYEVSHVSTTFYVGKNNKSIKTIKG